MCRRSCRRITGRACASPSAVRARRSRMGMTTRSIRGGALRPCRPISPQRSATPGTRPPKSVATICPAYR
jgi:hypothetical protein